MASGLESYRFAFAITEHLTQADPGNDYRISLALAERLANADPANSAWQRELALSHGRIGMVLARQGSQRDAVVVLKQGHAILLRLRQQAPGDAAVPTDVAWFEERMAELVKEVISGSHVMLSVPRIHVRQACAAREERR